MRSSLGPSSSPPTAPPPAPSDSEEEEEEADMAKRLYKDGTDGPFPTSEYVPSRSVKGLVQTNFNKFLDDKKAALVMFYDPDCQFCSQAKPHFMKAAKSLSGAEHGFASVDCTQEPGLCESESVKNFPTFKLYVGGKFLTSYNDTPNFDTMRKFVMNAPTGTVVKEPVRRDEF